MSGDAAAEAPGIASPGSHTAPAPAPERGRRRRWVRVLVAVLVALGLYALLGFVVAPQVAQSQLAQRLPAELGRPVTIGRVEFNPFTLLLRVHELSVSEPTGDAEFAGFARLEADLSWRSLYRLAPVLSSVSLQRPRVRVARDAQGRYGIQDLLDKWSARPSADPGPTPHFSVANIVVDDGRFEFDDGKLGVRQEIAAFALRVPFVSSLPVDETIWTEPSLRATVNGAPFELVGRSLPFSPTHESTIDIDLDGIDLTGFVGYAPAGLPVELRSGRLDTELKIAFSQAPGAAPTIAVTGKVKLASLDIRQPDGAPLLTAESIVAEPIALAWPENRYTIGRVTVNAADVAVRRKAGQRRFLEPVLAAIEHGSSGGAAPAAAPPQPSSVAAPPASPQWAIDEIVVAGGKLAFGDAQFQPRSLQLDASAVQATVRKLASDPAVPAEFELRFALAGGELAQAAGTTSWRDGAVDAKVQLSQLALKQWWWIPEPRLAVDAIDGTLALEARVRVTPVAGGTAAIRIDDGSLQLTDLSLRQRWDKRTLLTLPRLDLGGVSVDLSRRTVGMDALTTNGGKLLVHRDVDARFNLQRVVHAQPDAALAANAAPQAPRRASGEAAVAPGWTLSLEKLAIAGFGVDIEDQRAGRAANLRLRAVDVAASRLSSADRAAPARIEVRAQVDRRGALSLAGDVALAPLAGRVQVVARDLVIVPLQPYFTEYVNALVSSGALSARGSLGFAVPANAVPRLSWKGNASIADFAAVSKEASSELLRWKTLAFDQIHFDSAPLKVDVGSIALSDFYARVILSAEGRLNLRDLLVDRSEPGKPQGAPAVEAAAPSAASAVAPGRAAGPSPPRDLRVGGVRLVDGNIDFSDFFIEPNYSANLTGMNGQISQITPDQAGDIELRGRIDHTGSVAILGKVNPLAEPLFLDLKADASDIDLPRLSPYSGKYIGYGIDKGKLSAKVAYKVENRQLTAENNVVLDQLTFGDKVDSPDAIKLPVLFAVSLLKDRNGVIDVNLPISGSLDDPKFSVGGLVLRIIVNLIVKVVTAPFALIANLAGASGAELSWIGFGTGAATLDADAQRKLEAIAKALIDRPGLKLDLAGRADPAADREALRKLALARAVKAQKLRETVSGGTDSAAIDQVKIESQEYEKYLELAWRAAKFDKPRNAIGLVKSQPRAEMERMMLAHIATSDAELTALANERAQQVKDWLVDSGKVPGERVFIVAPKIGAGGDAVADDAKPAAAPPSASRVDLSLK